MYEDNPMALVMQKRQSYYLGDNSYGRPTIGTIENISAFNQDMLFEHKENLYTKDNLIITIAGKIKSQEEIENQIAEIFQKLPINKRINKPNFTKHIPHTKTDFFDKKTEQNHLIIAAE
jgi:predicted Zn-dependent peptidase